MIENTKFADDLLICNGRPHCPSCLALSRLTHSVLDSRHGNTVHVYQCIGCGRRIWDEDPKPFARPQ
jgi:hypothetical protein